MRKFAFSVIALSLTIPAYGDDFSALLADLSFGDEPTLNAAMEVASSLPTDELKPAPTGFLFPELDAPTAQLDSPAAEPNDAMTEVASPIVSLQDPISSETAASEASIDLESAFTIQESEVPAESVGFRSHGCETDPGYCADSGCCDSPQSCGTGSCTQEPSITCIPRTKATLPSSTLRQYFRSNVCNTNVWDGYHLKCSSCCKHTHGQCDCLSKSRNRAHACGEVLPAATCNDCGSCDRTCD